MKCFDALDTKFDGLNARWLSPDPIAGSIFNPQSLNRYAYVMNNPVNFTDPLGLDPPMARRHSNLTRPSADGHPLPQGEG